MVGDIKAISRCVKSASAKLFLDLHTVSAPSGEERTLGAAAQVERATRCCQRSFCHTATLRSLGLLAVLAFCYPCVLMLDNLKYQYTGVAKS